MCLQCFYFQAEDGIRYRTVTGVQTCALPISGCSLGVSCEWHGHLLRQRIGPDAEVEHVVAEALGWRQPARSRNRQAVNIRSEERSCRERGETGVGGGGGERKSVAEWWVCEP